MTGAPITVADVHAAWRAKGWATGAPPATAGAIPSQLAALNARVNSQQRLNVSNGITTGIAFPIAPRTPAAHGAALAEKNSVAPLRKGIAIFATAVTAGAAGAALNAGGGSLAAGTTAGQVLTQTTVAQGSSNLGAYAAAGNINSAISTVGLNPTVGSGAGVSAPTEVVNTGTSNFPATATTTAAQPAASTAAGSAASSASTGILANGSSAIGASIETLGTVAAGSTALAKLTGNAPAPNMSPAFDYSAQQSAQPSGLNPLLLIAMLGVPFVLFM